MKIKVSKNILIVGVSGRKDILSLFENIKENANLFFLLHRNSLTKDSAKYESYGTVVTWEENNNAFELLKRLNVNLIVFLQFGDYNEIALRVAAKESKIASYMLSHGFMDSNNYQVIKEVSIESNKSLKNRLKNSALGSVISKNKNKFFQNTLKSSSVKNRDFMRMFFSLRSRFSMLETFDKIEHENLRLDKYICFNNNCKKWYTIKHKIKEKTQSDCILIGLPYYDDYFEIKGVNGSLKNILFVDQPFFEQSLFGWTKEIKRDFINQIIKLKGDAKFYVKEHPIGNREFWNQFENKIIVVKEENWMEVLSKTNIVIGFYSTLLLPLAAMNNKVMFTFENHPIKQTENLFSDFLTKNEVAEQCLTVNDFFDCLENIVKLQRKQNSKKLNFINNYLYKFDGKSKERLFNLIISDEAI